jgi:hypothetical protein
MTDATEQPPAEPYALYATTVWIRSKTVTKKPCICCDGGPHIFAYRLDLEPHDLMLTLPKHMRDENGWLYRACQSFPEGTRVRITVEAVGEPTEETS